MTALTRSLPFKQANWLRNPWLQFVLIGALIYTAATWRSDSAVSQAVLLDASDEARIERQWKLLGAETNPYLSLEAMREQALTEKVLFLEALRLDFHRQDPAIRQRLLATLEVLDLEDLPAGDEDPMETAIALGLHLGDEVVRQRMVLMMQVTLEALSTPRHVTEDDVQVAYATNRDRWMIPASITFSQAYLGEQADHLEQGELHKVWGDLELTQGLAKSKPFLSGYRFREQRPADVEAAFGDRFAQTLFSEQLPLASWQLPVPSAFGQHAVWVERLVAQKPMSLAEASDLVRQELEATALAEAITNESNRLRVRYGLDPVRID